MATTIALTPSVTGGVAQALLTGGGAGAGIHLQPDFKFPVPVSEHSYIESRDVEGRRRTHTRPMNPTGSGQVRIQGANAAAFYANLSNFQATVAAMNKHGGTMVFTPDGGTAVTYTIVAMDLAEDTNLDRFIEQEHAVVGFTFECEPYGKLSPVTIASNQAASAPLLVFDVADVPGHVDALGELTITDTATQERWYVEYGLEEITNASPNDLILSQPDLTATGLAGASNTRSGSFSTNTYRATLTSTPVAVCSTGSQPHEGLRRIYARVYADTALTYVRAEYRIGDGSWTTISEGWKLAIEDAWSDLFLGIIDVPESETFEVRIVAKCATAGGILDVDIVYPFPADRWGRARRKITITTPSAFIARDEFDQAAGNLNGKTLPSGQTWATSGAATDLAVEAAGHTVQRATTSDSEVSGPRQASITVASATEIVMSLDFKATVHASGLNVRLGPSLTGAFVTVPLLGTNSEIQLQVGSNIDNARVPLIAGEWYRLLFARIGGIAFAWVGRQGAPITPQVVVENTTTAYTAALFADLNTGSTPSTRNYDNFAVWSPGADAACFSGQSMRFLHNKMQRENAAGTKWGRVPMTDGDHLRIPPAGREDRLFRMAVRARRTDIVEMPDGNLTDATRADLVVTPRVLLTAP